MSAVLPAADPLDADVLEAVRKTLAEGFPVGLPTDTVYVLAVDPFVAGASDRLFSVKRRPRDLDLPAPGKFRCVRKTPRLGEIG